MRVHLIEVGPTAIRRLCCGGATVTDAELERIALESIDDPVALVDLQPVTVESLWRSIFESVDCSTADQVAVVHPSWWSSPRVDVLCAAAQALAGDAEMRPRSWLLTQSALATLTVEIAADFVVVSGAEMMAEPRRGDLDAVAEAVALSVWTAVLGDADAVVIDAPATVRGAKTLAAAIAKRLQISGGISAILVDDVLLRRFAEEMNPSDGKPDEANSLVTGRRIRWGLLLAALVACTLIGVEAMDRHSEPRTTDHFATTFLVEGHVALEVPAQWTRRRVVGGPGSARVQVTSPDDPEMALHVTQSRVALTGMDATAEFLKGAIDAAPVGVFVDFNPVDRSAGRPVVTYREVRAGHDIRWTVWVDKAVRISIGCQSRSGRDDTVGPECELAIRSARALK